MNYIPNQQLNKAFHLWLRVIWFMIFAMVIIGGATRLTNSGLSMVEWKIHTHFIPPLSLQAWNDAFAVYKSSPEFQKINFWMEVGDFKKIYLWEWLHRFWGQMTGLIVLFPLLFFTFQKAITPQKKRQLWLIFALGGFQGFLGWFMVKSGLVDNPHVSHFRLAIHLSFAALLLTLISHQIWQLNPINDATKAQGTKTLLLFLITLSFLTFLWGAFTAGLKAGLIYNSFPMMNGNWLPDEFFHGDTSLTATVLKMINTPGCVQFVHRCLALFLTLSILISYHKLPKKSAHALVFLLIFQITLGAITILYTVPLIPALLHQANALLLFLYLNKIFYQPNQNRELRV
jgi:cytochrome c oxidase assembly protein subunit 15